jgi:DNA-binding transcriptional ArsR family regulator
MQLVVQMSGKVDSTVGRWGLYRLLADPSRLRILALTAEHELTVGELSEVLGDSQPNVSRQAASLRQGGLIGERRQGRHSYVRLSEAWSLDAVVSDAVSEGRRLCTEEGRLDQLEAVVARRVLRSRDESSLSERGWEKLRLASELPVYVLAVGQITVERELAVDASTEDGAMLDVLAPFFRRVVAVEQSPTKLEHAERRIVRRGYHNVDLVCGDIVDLQATGRLRPEANAVFAARVASQATSRRSTFAALAALLGPGGQLVVADQLHPGDETASRRELDHREGFTKRELLELVAAAGLTQPIWRDVPPGFGGCGLDGQCPWQLLRATRGVTS